ncbi:MAG: ATP-binding protein [Candidatus Omnitrophica bacterium]|nr:ATP-binding protein [Candidatus Omnitrophota bacterium]MDD5487876.1 ATP-binding protein [Candidatus Omnitrophota bacterium]
MIISVASGKGGTGKTTVSTALALSLPGPVQLLDCDAEEPNAHIFIKPDIKRTEDVFIYVPRIDEDICTLCGRCAEVCAYNAIAVLPGSGRTAGRALVFRELCHGCGSCRYFCPENAIKEEKRKVGVVEVGYRGELEFVHGRMNIGEAMSPPVIRAVKHKLNKGRTVIVDAPPGTTCPVITAIHGSDACVLVTEPTPFGLHDLRLTVEVIKKMDIPFGVVINRHGLGDERTEEYCAQEGIPVLMKIPFSKEIAAEYSRGISIVEAFPEYRDEFAGLVKKLEEEMSR